MKTLSQSAMHPALIPVILIVFFALIVIGIILVKKYVKPLQIKKPDIDEKEAVKEELDRVLVPVEDEEIQKQMEEAAKKDNIDVE